MSDLPSGSNQIKHTKKPYIASLWTNENLMRCMLVLLFVILFVTHNLQFCLYFIRTKRESTAMKSTLSLLESQRLGGLLLSRASICLRVWCTRVTLT